MTKRQKLLIGFALLVGIVTFCIGFGVELSDDALSAAKDALNAGVEAISALILTALGGLVLSKKGATSG